MEEKHHLAGSYTSLPEMAGAWLSVLDLDDEVFSLWDAPLRTPARRWERGRP